MNKFNINFLVIFMVFVCVPSWGGQCKSIPQLGNSSDKTGYVESSGAYCLTYDIVQDRVFDIHAGSFKAPMSALLVIQYEDRYFDNDKKKYVPNLPGGENLGFDIDLMGHLLTSSDTAAVGIRARGGIRNISIRNGRIELSNAKRSLGIGLENGDGQLLIRSVGGFSREENIGEIKNEDIPVSETIDKKQASYQDAKNIVDNVKISATKRGVVMGGGKNILRYSTIQVDGNSAVFLYGPGTIIENNTIIISGNGDLKPFDAAIKLRDAKGSIVRNNRIIYKGAWFTKAPAAINLHDSSDVVIEGNTVENFKALVRIVGDSNVIEKNNVLK